MKNKLTVIVLSLAIVLSSFVFAGASTTETKIGDVTNDGVIDLNDVVLLAQYVAGWDVELASGTTEIEIADVTNEGKVSLDDVVLLAQYVAGWDVELAPEIENVVTDFDNDNEETLYDNAPSGTTLQVLMWRAYNKTEQKMIVDFQMKTGIKVTTTVTTEAEYASKLVSMISEGNSPDVVMFHSGCFPGLVRFLQSLDEKTFRLDSDCWNKTYMDCYKVNGLYFGVAMPGSWNCEDGNYVTYYDPTVLKDCGITTMPYDLYRDGKWNWDSQYEIIRKVKIKGNGYIPLIMKSTDMFMLSAGTDFASYGGSSFTNNLGSVEAGDLITKAWQQMVTIKTDDSYSEWNITGISQGKVGLAIGDAYGMNKESNWFDYAANGYENLQAVPVAGPKGRTAYTPSSPRVWGVARGAKNDEGAAYFLRYFLDTDNCDMSSTFYNTQFETVYNIITKTGARKKVMFGSGVTDYISSGTYSNVCNYITSATLDNVHSALNSRMGSVDIGLSRANKDLAKIK